MHYREIARILLEGGSLEDKLLPLKNVDFTESTSGYELPENPGRSNRLKFDNQQVKFPRNTSFHLEEKRGLALHFFANHELLAIEMMSAALLIYPDHGNDMIQFKKGLIKTIADEQKHLKLYLARMGQFGIELGDFPLNDFFWRSMEKLKTPSHFYAAMAMTFESANLDFAQYYEKCFQEVEDLETANIMRIVFEDEISHVALGARWLNLWRGDKDLWSYFLNYLPGVMTPARSKGIHFDRSSRERAGLDNAFLDQLEAFRDDFKVTNRKSW
ncbi:MAG: DUF455 family protein [Bacteriovorax sp.]|jgi:uncharacterized ferritin-like protein (DUF455 family)